MTRLGNPFDTIKTCLCLYSQCSHLNIFTIYSPEGLDAIRFFLKQLYVGQHYYYCLWALVLLYDTSRSLLLPSSNVQIIQKNEKHAAFTNTLNSLCASFGAGKTTYSPVRPLQVKTPMSFDADFTRPLPRYHTTGPRYALSMPSPCIRSTILWVFHLSA